ncbi:hypothetical protein HPB48_001410 [Haemaphysalis longicornis]|uniref:Uncharacterized protein n=1 Tax=Haemaphysalis longicornis TaxID=44386 RepID=A0A9J6GVG0_HAELO|nr:hypothetical protein HPB48_001410 [Haemaphysalis longicornis]
MSGSIATNDRNHTALHFAVKEGFANCVRGLTKFPFCLNANIQRNWDNITSVKQHNPVRCVAQRMPKKAEGAISLFFPTDIQYPSRNSSTSMAVNKAVKRLNMTATLRKEKQHMKVKQADGPFAGVCVPHRILRRHSGSDHDLVCGTRQEPCFPANRIAARRCRSCYIACSSYLGDHDQDLNNRLLWELFLQRLPQNIVLVLAAAPDMPLDQLAELADRIADYSRSPSIAAVVDTPSTSRDDSSLGRLESRNNELSHQLSSLAPLLHRRRRASRDRRRSRCPWLRILSVVLLGTMPSHTRHSANLPENAKEVLLKTFNETERVAAYLAPDFFP